MASGDPEIVLDSSYAGVDYGDDEDGRFFILNGVDRNMTEVAAVGWFPDSDPQERIILRRDYFSPKFRIVEDAH